MPWRKQPSDLLRLLAQDASQIHQWAAVSGDVVTALWPAMAISALQSAPRPSAAPSIAVPTPNE